MAPVVERDCGEMPDLIAIDLGNSFTRVTVRGPAGCGLPLRVVTPCRGGDRWAQRLTRRIDAREPARTIIASVVPHLTPPLIEALSTRFGNQIHEVSWQSLAGMSWGIPNPQTLGADRICAIAGALADHHPPLLIIDCGTAVTIDVIDRGPTYLGGAILPGIVAQFGALARNTAKLKEIPVAIATDPLGLTTAANVQAGVFYGLVGGLRWLIAAYRERLACAAPVLATGGGMAPLLSYIPAPQVYRPDLVCQGLIQLAAGSPWQTSP